MSIQTIFNKINSDIQQVNENLESRPRRIENRENYVPERTPPKNRESGNAPNLNQIQKNIKKQRITNDFAREIAKIYEFSNQKRIRLNNLILELVNEMESE